MCYDITFCNRKCSNKNCIRNLLNANKFEIIERQGVWVAEFKDCKEYKEELRWIK